MSKSINFSEIEKRILEYGLVDDDRLQQHYAKEIFNCHYLPDLVQHLRPKLGKLFKKDGMDILATEYHTVKKIDGKTARIGIYRLNENYKPKIKKLLDGDNQGVDKNETL